MGGGAAGGAGMGGAGKSFKVGNMEFDTNNMK